MKEYIPHLYHQHVLVYFQVMSAIFVSCHRLWLPPANDKTMRPWTRIAAASLKKNKKAFSNIFITSHRTLTLQHGMNKKNRLANKVQLNLFLGCYSYTQALMHCYVQNVLLNQQQILQMYSTYDNSCWSG